MSAREIWKLIPQEGRDKILAEVDDHWTELLQKHPHIADCVANALSFRPKIVRAAQPGSRAGLVRRALVRWSDPLIEAFLMAALEELRPELFKSFAEAVPGEDEHAATPDASAGDGDRIEGVQEAVSEAFSAVVDGLRDEWPPLELAWLLAGTASFAASVPGFDAAATVRSLFESGRPTEGGGARRPGADELAETETEPDPEPPELHAPSFTTLDRTIIRSIVSALNDVEGSLDWMALDDLVQELVDLNDSRSRSHFHRGFLDRLRDRALAGARPGDNADRRAWYVAGWILGALRRMGRAGAAGILGDLDPRDRRALLEPASEAGRMVASEVVGPLLESGELEVAHRWITTHGSAVPIPVARAADAWSEQALADTDHPEQVARILQAAHQAVAPHASDPLLRGFLRRSARRRAIALRQAGRQEEASRLLDELLKTATDPEERGRLQAQRLLVRLGIRRLEDLALPADERARAALLEALAAAQEDLEPDARNGIASPITLFTLALPAVAPANKGSEEEKRAARRRAAEYLRRAIDLMAASEEEVWSGSGLIDRAAGYLAALELRELEPRVAPAAVDSLVGVLTRGVMLPADVVVESLNAAAVQDARGTAELARLVLEQYEHELLERVRARDLEDLAARAPRFRELLAELLESSEQRLQTAARWDFWHALLRAARRSSPADLQAGERALDQLERIAGDPAFADRWIRLLNGDAREWDPFWSVEDRDEALLNAYLRAGRTAEAEALAGVFVHRAIANEDLERAGLVLAALDPHKVEVTALRKLLDTQWWTPDAEVEVEEKPVFVNVLFVGGNETQARYEADVRREVERRRPGTRVQFEFPGWSANWGRQVPRLRASLAQAHALVLMRFVRTQLGRSLRKLARELDKPWVACPGHGKDSMVRAVIRAVDVARELKQREGEARA